MEKPKATDDECQGVANKVLSFLAVERLRAARKRVRVSIQRGVGICGDSATRISNAGEDSLFALPAVNRKKMLDALKNLASLYPEYLVFDSKLGALRVTLRT